MLSIIIINYNSAKLIIDCIQSIVAQTVLADYEIIVVDNSQRNEDELLIKEHFPKVRWINMGYNAGFARANNAAIRQAKGNAMLLLNPDTIVIENAIDKVYVAFMNNEQAVACGVQLLNEDRTPQISGNFAMKGGLNYLLPLPYVGPLLKWIGELVHVKKPNIPEVTDITKVDWINGAFLMVKTSVLDKSGLLDEDFFLYAEEAEWCSRLRQNGNLYIYGKCHVIHLQGETATDAFGSEDKAYNNIFDKKGKQIIISNFVRIRKEFGTIWYLINLLIYTFSVPCYYLGLLIEYILQRKKSTKDVQKANGLACNVASLWKLTGKIISNQPHFYKVL